MSAPRCGLVLVGGGSSERMGGIDKVWVEICGKPLFLHSLERFLPLVAQVALVLRADRIAAAEMLVAGMPSVRIVPGGATRQESVWNGIRALPALEIIAVHDVARPLAPAALLAEGIRVLTSAACAGAIPVVPVTDTIKRVDPDGTVRGTEDRTSLRAVQTPQVFDAPNLLAAHGAALQTATAATDDAMLLETRGDRVLTFPGVSENFKVTSPLDLRLAKLLLAGVVIA